MTPEDAKRRQDLERLRREVDETSDDFDRLADAPGPQMPEFWLFVFLGWLSNRAARLLLGLADRIQTWIERNS